MIMSNHTIMSMITFLIIMLLMIMIKIKYQSNLNSISNVECGFSSMSEKKFKFPNQFFMISILFVIFDMELIAIIPTPYLMINMNLWMILISIFIMFSFSIMMEWMNGLIEWIKS